MNQDRRAHVVVPVNDDAPRWLTIPLLIIVVPVRLLWEALSAAGRLIQAYVLRPVAWLFLSVVVRPLMWALRVLVLLPFLWALWILQEAFSAAGRLIRAYVLRPVAWLFRNLVARPLVWALRVLVLLPLWWALRILAVLPGRWIYQVVLVPLGLLILRYVLRPFGRAVAWAAAIVAVALVWAMRWLGRGLTVLGRGLAALWRAVLWPFLAAFGRLLVLSWHLAGVVLFHLLVRPVRFLWRALVRPALRAARQVWRATAVPAARWTRAHVWEPARVTARSISRSLGLDTRRP